MWVRLFPWHVTQGLKRHFNWKRKLPKDGGTQSLFNHFSHQARDPAPPRS